MQLRALFGLCLAVLLFPGLANAHGPTRQKLTKKIEINAPAEKVWSIVGNFQDMSWHPAVKSSTGERGNTVNDEDENKGATRTLDLGDGKTVQELLYKYDAERMRYSYRVKKVAVEVLPVNDLSAHIILKGDGDKTTVIWKSAFYRGYMNNDPPEHLNEAAAKKAVSEMFDAGLENLKKLAEGK